MTEKMKKIGEGFDYQVYDNGDGTVHKIPRKPGKISTEKKSYRIHKNYLGKYLPETKFNDDGEGNIKEATQTQIEAAEIVNLEECTSEQLKEILKLGKQMQNENGILFDIFGMEGMIQLFNYYFKGTYLKNLSDLFLPLNSYFLKKIKGLPKGLLKEMNNNKKSPFLAYNILKDRSGNIYFVDTNYRPLNIFNPLNLIGKWITDKALKDLENKNKIQI